MGEGHPSYASHSEWYDASAMFVYLLNDILLLTWFLVLCGVALALIGLRAFRVIVVEKSKLNFLEPGFWSLMCMVWHFATGLYSTSYYSSLCVKGGVGPLIFHFFPVHFAYGLGETAHFYFMWMRARLTKFPIQLRTRAYNKTLKMYQVACILHLVALLCSVGIAFVGKDELSFHLTCEGDWITVPLNNEHEVNVSMIKRNFAVATVGLFILMEFIATFTGVYLFWKPMGLRISFSQALMARWRYARGSSAGNSSEMTSSLHEKNSSSVHITDREERNDDLEGAMTEAARRNLESVNREMQHDRSILYWNLVPAFTTQVMYLVWMVVSLWMSAAYGRLHAKFLTGMSFAISNVVFVPYYSLVFRDHLWATERSNCGRASGGTPRRWPAPSEFLARSSSAGRGAAATARRPVWGGGGGARVTPAAAPT